MKSDYPPIKTPPTSSEIRTFFYVFIGREVTDNPRSDLKQRTGNMQAMSLETIIEFAFEKFAQGFSKEAIVKVNPLRFHDLRNAYGISQLPAFGISDVDLSDKAFMGSKPRGLPSRLEFWRRAERKRMLQSGKFLPKVERRILEQYADVDRLYHLVCDLHIANLDQGLAAVALKIEKEILSIGGKKLLNAIVTGKRQFFG